MNQSLKLWNWLMLAWLVLNPAGQLAAQGTAFTYQGQLSTTDGPANGSYDLVFALYNDSANGALLAGPVTNRAVWVTNGLFTTTVDFGTGIFTGGNDWLELSVSTNQAGDFTTLSPRQPLYPVPYALYSGNSGTAANATTVAATGITGVIPLAQLPPGVVTNNASGISLAGNLIGNAKTADSAALATNVVSGIAITNAFLTNGIFAGNGAGLTNVAYNSLSGIPVIPTTNGFVTAAITNGLASTAYVQAQGYLTNANGANAAVATNVVSGIAITNAFLTNGVFAGNGAGLTNLNAANLTLGTLSLSQLPAVVLTNGAAGLSLAGVFSGNGAALTNVNLATVNGNGALAWVTNAGYTNIFFQMATNGTLPVGAFPQALTAGDVNLDGSVDLICANAGAGTLSVLTNNGSGTFGFNSTLTVGSVPVAVVAVDLNGDGAADLVSANNYANSLTVLTNNGRGIFGSNASYSVGSGPMSLVAAHVSGTANWDLVVANLGNNTVTVLTNNGRGGFALASNLPVGKGPVSVTAADFNGDGAVDLVSANSTDGTFTMWVNNGSGQFVASATLTVGNDPQAVVALDVNGDGRPDLISANFNDSTLTVFLNHAGGTFGTGTVYPVGANPAALVAVDVNGDRNVDLISAGQGANVLTVLTNNGSGAFSLATTLGSGSSPDALVAADINGDHLMDLVAANQAGGNLSVYTNASLVTAVPASPVPVPTFSGAFTGSGAALTNISPASITGGVTTNLPVVLTNGHTNILVIVNGIITKIQ